MKLLFGVRVSISGGICEGVNLEMNLRLDYNGVLREAIAKSEEPKRYVYWETCDSCT